MADTKRRTSKRSPGGTGPGIVRAGSEHERKLAHIRKLLVCRQESPAQAEGWMRYFGDDADPTFPVRDWLDAGWSNPDLVGLGLEVCGSQRLAEQCMALLNHRLDEPPSPGLRLKLLAGLRNIAASAPAHHDALSRPSSSLDPQPAREPSDRGQ